MPSGRIFRAAMWAVPIVAMCFSSAGSAWAKPFNWKTVYGNYIGTFPLCSYSTGEVYAKDARAQFLFDPDYDGGVPSFRLAVYKPEEGKWVGVVGEILYFDASTGNVSWHAGGALEAGKKVAGVTVSSGIGPGFYTIGNWAPFGKFVNGDWIGVSSNGESTCGRFRLRRMKK